MNSNSDRPADDAILAKLDALAKSVDAGFSDLHARVDDVARVAARAADAAAGASKVALHAQGDAIEAKRMVSDVQQSQSDTVRAMQAHAASVAASSTAIVKANDEQTPVLQQTLDIAVWLKKSAPVLMERPLWWAGSSGRSLARSSRDSALTTERGSSAAYPRH